MATAVLPKTARPSSPTTNAAPIRKAPARATIDNQRTEDFGRFAIVVMMPIVLVAMVCAIAFWLTPALQ